MPTQISKLSFCSDQCLKHLLSESMERVWLSTKKTAVLDGDIMYIPFNGEIRQESHVLGKTDLSVPRGQLLQRLKQVEHPNLMSVTAVCNCMLQTRRLHGTPLFSVLNTALDQQEGFLNNTNDRLRYSDWSRWMSGIISGLKYLHRLGLAHGDMFPYNIFISGNNAVIIDYEDISDNREMQLIDILSFLMNIVAFTLMYTESYSQNLIDSVLQILEKTKTEKMLENLQQAFSLQQKDLQILSPMKVFVRLSENFARFKGNPDATFQRVWNNFIQRRNLWFYHEALWLFHERKNTEETLQQERLLHRFQEHEIRRLMVPKDLLVQTESQLKQCRETIQLLQNQLLHQQDEVNQLNQEMPRMEEEKRSQLEQISCLKMERDSLKNKISSLEEERNTGREQFELLKNEKTALNNQLSLLQKEQIASAKRIASLENERNAFALQIADLQKNCQRLNAEREEEQHSIQQNMISIQGHNQLKEQLQMEEDNNHLLQELKYQKEELVEKLQELRNLLEEQKQLTTLSSAALRRAVFSLESLKMHKSMRIAKTLSYIRNLILHGQGIRSRCTATRHLLNKLLGIDKVLLSDSPLDIPLSELRSIDRMLGKLNFTNLPPLTLPSTSAPSEVQNILAIPPAIPKTEPYIGIRAPYGKRTVAILTNQLLDWQDHRERFGGGERYALNIARLLKKFGFTVHFYQVAFEEFKGEYYGFPVFAMKLKETFSEFHYATCNEFLERTRHYDHVYYNMPEYSSGTVRSDGIMTCHGIWFDHNNAPNLAFRTTEWYTHLGRIFANPARIISVDTNSINVIRSLWPELAPKMQFIPNFVDTTVFHPQEKARNPQKLRVLFPRRSQINRGSRILGDILKRIPHEVEIHWVGEGDAQDTDIILDLCKKDSRLHYHSANFDDMPSWYQKCDIAVIPTIACEGTSLSCIEAMACGCATISTNVGGLTDLVFPGFDGILCNPTPQDLAEAVNSLIEDPALLKKYQTKALEGARNFSLANWQKAWTRCLLEQDWISEEQAVQSGILEKKELPRAIQGKTVILTRNAIHGGVESIIKEERRFLNADVIVCGGHDIPSTCPFPYRRADDKETLSGMLTEYAYILYHWIPDYAVEAVAASGKTSIEFVHRVDTMGCDKSVPYALVTHSKFLAEYVSKVTSRECEVVEHPIDTGLFAQTTPSTDGCIGALTSYYQTKGIDRFLKAWALLKDKFSNIPVRFYGAGTDKEEFQKLAKDLNLEVDFREATTTPEKALREFRCFVVPSRIEGLPMAILEALAMNIPVIASDLPGMREFNELAVKRGFPEMLHLVEEDNIKQLAAKIEEILVSPPKKSRSREYIQEFYSPEQHARHLQKIFEKCVNKTGKRS